MKKIAHRNKSPTGWWIASYVECAIPHKKPGPRARVLSWENTIILKAPNRDVAYTKSVKLASQNKSRFKGGRWKFMGITELLPLYEPLRDGAEILWAEQRETLEKVRRRVVKRKMDLPIFDDTPEVGDSNEPS